MQEFLFTLFAGKIFKVGVRMECTEREIESFLVNRVKALKGMARKWVSPGWDGAPDRIVLLPQGRIAFVELKKPAEQPRRLQLKRAKELQALGFKVFCGVDSKAEVERLLEEVSR